MSNKRVLEMFYVYISDCLRHDSTCLTYQNSGTETGGSQVQVGLERPCLKNKTNPRTTLKQILILIMFILYL